MPLLQSRRSPSVFISVCLYLSLNSPIFQSTNQLIINQSINIIEIMRSSNLIIFCLSFYFKKYCKVYVYICTVHHFTGCVKLFTVHCILYKYILYTVNYTVPLVSSNVLYTTLYRLCQVMYCALHCTGCVKLCTVHYTVQVVSSNVLYTIHHCTGCVKLCTVHYTVQVVSSNVLYTIHNCTGCVK